MALPTFHEQHRNVRDRLLELQKTTEKDIEKLLSELSLSREEVEIVRALAKIDKEILELGKDAAFFPCLLRTVLFLVEMMSHIKIIEIEPQR